ncbi:MAG: nucleotidyltransferase family protein [Sphingobium sp.]
MSGVLLVDLLRTPERAAGLCAPQWNGVMAAGRAERLLATLACRLDGMHVPDEVRAVLADARRDAARDREVALWEADRASAALAPLGIPVILLKGAAYVAGGLSAGEGRMIGDLDILVARDRLDEAEQALLVAGWEWVKDDPYDELYYRRWMHELPPMIHRERDRMIDVHHTILPLTARPVPDAGAMIADRRDLGGGLYMLSPEDRVCHAVAHMLADGDLAGGLRNLWDIRCLLSDIEDRHKLEARAAHHGLAPHLARALRLVDHLYGTRTARLGRIDRLFARRLTASDGWGRDWRRMSGLAFYIRSHWLRMPPGMLMRHLWTKWRKGHRPA